MSDNALGITNPTDYFQSFYYVVAVDNVKYGAFADCTLPSLSVRTTEIIEGGQNSYVHKLPVAVDVGTVSFKRGLTRSSMFLTWYLQVLNGNISDATRQVAVIMYDSQTQPIVTFNFRNAYPIKWRGPSLKSDASAIAIEEVELAHHGFDIS